MALNIWGPYFKLFFQIQKPRLLGLVPRAGYAFDGTIPQDAYGISTHGSKPSDHRHICVWI